MTNANERVARFAELSPEDLMMIRESWDWARLASLNQKVSAFWVGECVQVEMYKMSDKSKEVIELFPGMQIKIDGRKSSYYVISVETNGDCYALEINRDKVSFLENSVSLVDNMKDLQSEISKRARQEEQKAYPFLVRHDQ